MSEWLDSDRYPSMPALERIKSWPFDMEQAKALMAFVEELWTYKDCFICDPYHRTYTVRTAGWSGNEDLISALRQNTIFWTLCWVSSHRGGKHVFQIPEFR